MERPISHSYGGFGTSSGAIKRLSHLRMRKDEIVVCAVDRAARPAIKLARQPIRSIQEFLGHADSKTTQIYMHYAPSELEVEMVNRAFSSNATGNKTENKLSETDENSKTETAANRHFHD